MKKHFKKIYKLLAISIFLSMLSLAFSLEVPPIEKNFCHDNAGLLTSEQVEEIEGFLKDLNEKSKVQLALLTITSLEDEVIEDYSIRVAQEWKLGDKQTNAGGLLLISKNERKVRIEAGYGLEAFVTDAIASLIIKNVIAPAFKKSDYYTGIKEGLIAISGYALQDESLIATVEGKDKNKKNTQSPWTHILIFFGILMIILRLLRRKALPKNMSATGSALSRGVDVLPSILGGVSTLLNKDDSSDDGPLGKGGSFGGGGATGGW